MLNRLCLPPEAERILACTFLVGSDRTRYGKLLEDLQNDHTQGTDNYPATLQQAYSLLVHWKQDPCNIVHLIGGINDGDAFMTVSMEGGHERSDWGPRCYSCRKPGHITRNCPDKEDRDNNANGTKDDGNDMTVTQLLMHGAKDLVMEESFQFTQVDGQLPVTWVLLDNQLTVNIFCNWVLLPQDVRLTNRCLHVQCNAGSAVTNLIRRFPGYPGEIWYNLDGITNILLLGDVEKHFCVLTYDRDQEKSFIVEKSDGTKCQLVKTKEGLY